MAEFPSLPLFTDAFIADTMHLTAAQTGAYIMLLMCAWRSPDCCLPDNDELLARFARMDMRAWKANKDVIMSFWMQDADGLWFQKRLSDERKYVAAKRNRNVQAGRISALKRHERGSTDVPTKPQHKPNEPITPLNLERKEGRKEEGLCTLPVNMVITDSVGPALEKSASETPKQKRGERLEAFLEREGVDTTAKAWGDWARTRGMAVSTIDATMESFRDWWRSAPAAKGVKADWPATWRGWVRRELEKIKEKEKRDALFKKR